MTDLIAGTRSEFYAPYGFLNRLVKLIGERSQKFKDKGVDTALMTTQATNRAVLKVWERHGYRFGPCSHIFSIYQRKR
jgi:hypothetical protein